jgi:RNA polymerase sigma-70 factor (ECF subfamily)
MNRYGSNGVWQLNGKPLWQQDDRELVSGFLAERREATFRELYRRHTPLVYRVCLRLLSGDGVRPAGSPEDAAQECWLRAIRALDGFEWQSRLSTWLVGIAIRVCAELRRAPAQLLDLEEYREALDAADSQGLPLDEVDVERLLQQIAPGYRLVVMLHDLEGFTHQEIAAVLEVSSGTVKSQLSRGRRALRALAEVPARAGGRSAT